MESSIHVNNISGDAPPKSLPRNTAVSATSAVSVLRRSGACCAEISSILDKSFTPRAEIVLIGPADIAFTRILLGPSSLARYFTSASSAAFATPITL